jgi:hypothetical protein
VDSLINERILVNFSEYELLTNMQLTFGICILSLMSDMVGKATFFMHRSDKKTCLENEYDESKIHAK